MSAEVEKKPEENLFSSLQLPTPSSVSKYFVCNHCKAWNLIKPEDVRDLQHDYEDEKQIKDVHIELPEILARRFKSFCVNFGGYKAGITVILNEFEKLQAIQQYTSLATPITKSNES